MTNEQERLGVLIVGFLLVLSTWGFPGDLIRIESWVTISSITLLLTLYVFNWSASKKKPVEAIVSYCGALYHSSNAVRIYAIALISLAIILIVSYCANCLFPHRTLIRISWTLVMVWEWNQSRYSA